MVFEVNLLAVGKGQLCNRVALGLNDFGNFAAYGIALIMVWRGYKTVVIHRERACLIVGGACGSALKVQRGRRGGSVVGYGYNGGVVSNA